VDNIERAIENDMEFEKLATRVCSECHHMDACHFGEGCAYANCDCGGFNE